MDEKREIRQSAGKDDEEDGGTQDRASDLSGQLLLAMPGLADPNFQGAVVLVAEHNAKGALGLMINKPTEMTLDSLFERIEVSTADAVAESDAAPAWNGIVFYGGPVQTDRGFVLHEAGGQFNSTVSISDSIALTTSKDVLESVATGRGPRRMLVTLGYSGWGPGQLESEIAQNVWLTMPVDPELLFDTPAADRFAMAYRRLGIDPTLLSPRAGHA